MTTAVAEFLHCQRHSQEVTVLPPVRNHSSISADVHHILTSSVTITALILAPASSKS